MCAKVKADIQGRLNNKKFYKYTYKWFLNLDHFGDRIKAFTELIQVPLSKGTGNINRTRESHGQSAPIILLQHCNFTKWKDKGI